MDLVRLSKRNTVGGLSCQRTRSDIAAKVVQGTGNVLVLVYWVDSGGFGERADRIDAVTLTISLDIGTACGLGDR